MLLFLVSCVSEPLVEVEESSLGAEVVIHHLQTQPESKNVVKGVQIWSNSEVEWVQQLSVLFGGTPIHELSQLRQDHIVVVPVIKGVGFPELRSKRVVSVLEGNWSSREIDPILRFSEGLIELNKSISRYTEPKDVSSETKALAVAKEISNHYGIAHQEVPKSWRQSIDKGMWTRVSTEWLEKDATDPRIRTVESKGTANPANLLAQFKLIWSESDMIGLVKHPDPWVRAQTALISEETSLLPPSPSKILS